MLRPLIAGALATLLVGGCASVDATERAGLAWSRSEDPDSGAALILTGLDADDPRLKLSCWPGSGAVDLTVIGDRDDGAVVELHSGKIWNRYPGVGVPDGSRDGAFDVTVRLAAIDPVLLRLADTGELVVTLGARRIRTPNAFAPAHDFLAACRAG